VFQTEPTEIKWENISRRLREAICRVQSKPEGPSGVEIPRVFFVYLIQRIREVIWVNECGVVTERRVGTELTENNPGTVT
jgi:hypothetical protein